MYMCICILNYTADGASAYLVQVKVLRECFDFEALKALVARPDFSLCYDSMSGVQVIYTDIVL